jgi:hypothetical protein
MVVINSVYSSSVVASASSDSTVTSDLTIRAIAPGGFDYASRFTSIRSELDNDVQEYRKFAQRAAKKKGKTNNSPPHVECDHLFALVRHGNTKEVADLLSNSESCGDEFVDQYGNTLLITACQNNRIDIAEYLLSNGANVNAQNFSGNSSLHYACKFRYTDLINKLIKTDSADTSTRNSIGRRCYDMM